MIDIIIVIFIIFSVTHLFYWVLVSSSFSISFFFFVNYSSNFHISNITFSTIILLSVSPFPPLTSLFASQFHPPPTIFIIYITVCMTIYTAIIISFTSSTIITISFTIAPLLSLFPLSFPPLLS